MPPPPFPLHAFAAMAAFVLGLVQFAAPKGTLPHRTIGWIWVLLMAAVAASSFWIHQIRLVGPWSPIHLLSIFTLVMLPLAVWRAHRHRVTDHRRIMIAIFAGALVVAGLFTLLPGRIMHAVVFGPLAPVRSAAGGVFSRALERLREAFRGRFRGGARRAGRPRKSLEKRSGKTAAPGPLKGGLEAPDTLYDSQPRTDRIPPLSEPEDKPARRAAGAFRYSSRIHPRRDETLLPRLRHERDRGAGAAGCARRPEAGASAHSVFDVRAGAHARQEVRQVRARRRRRDR